MTPLMSSPGHIDPVPVARPAEPRLDGKIDLVGLSKAEMRGVLAGAGLDDKGAKLRAKQIWHWIYKKSLLALLVFLFKIFGICENFIKNIIPIQNSNRWLEKLVGAII